MAKNLIDNSKVYIHYYYNNGVWVENPTHKFNGRPVTQEAINFASEFFHFLIDSKFLNKETKLWLNSNLSSMREMVEAYNSQVDEPDRLDVHATESNIHTCKKKLKAYFSVNMLDEVFAYPEKNLQKNIEILDSLQRANMPDREYMASLVIKIPKGPINKELDERSYALLLKLLQTYSKTTIDSINNGTHNIYTSEMYGYFNYLISSKRLDKQDKERLKEVKQVLGINEV